MVKHLTGNDIGLVSVNERNLPLFRNVKITGSTVSILAHYIINMEGRAKMGLLIPNTLVPQLFS